MLYFNEGILSSHKKSNTALGKLAEEYQDNEPALLDILHELEGRTGKKPSILKSNRMAREKTMTYLMAIANKPELAVTLSKNPEAQNLPTGETLKNLILENVRDYRKLPVVEDEIEELPEQLALPLAVELPDETPKEAASRKAYIDSFVPKEKKTEQPPSKRHPVAKGVAMVLALLTAILLGMGQGMGRELWIDYGKPFEKVVLQWLGF